MLILRDILKEHENTTIRNEIKTGRVFFLLSSCYYLQQSSMNKILHSNSYIKVSVCECVI